MIKMMRTQNKTIYLLDRDVNIYLEEFAKEQRRRKEGRISYPKWKALKNMFGNVILTIDGNGDLCFTGSASGKEVESIRFLYNEDSNFCNFIIELTKDMKTQSTLTTNTYKYAPIVNISSDGALLSLDLTTPAAGNILTINNSIRTNPIEKKEEKKTMMNIKGFEFGAVNSTSYRMSHLGIAIKNKAQTFVSYDAKKKQIIDVDLFDFNMQDMIYKIPVALKDVKAGDVVMHNGIPMFVEGFSELGTVVAADEKKTISDLIVVDPVAGERKTIMPTRSIFGFDFVTKIVSLIDMSNLSASEDAPFGNLLPLMMMGGNGGKMDMMTMMMMSQLGGKSEMTDMFSNPMMMMAMMGDKNDNSMMPLMMMSGMFK